MKQDLVSRYSGSILGGAWSFVMPLVNILIFVVIFSKIMGARLEMLGGEFAEYSYSIYLVSGILAWTAFSNTVSRVTNIFTEKASLIGKVNISLLQLPTYIVLTETVIFAISYLFFLAFILIIGFPLSEYALLIPFVFIVQQILAYAIGFICAVIGVFIKDVKELVGVGMHLWFWLTPIVYVVDILPEHVRIFFMMNPIYHIMTAYRDLLMYQKLPDLLPLTIILVLAVSMLMAGIYLCKKLERDIRDFI
ncbi:MAG: ABC transporter permease [Neptuniibacter sp.]